MIRRLLTIFSVLSLLLFCAIAIVCVANNSIRVHNLMYNWGIPVRIDILPDYASAARSGTRSFGFFSDTQGLTLVSYYPSPPVRGPTYGTRAYPTWEKQFTQQNVVSHFLGFRSTYWSHIHIRADGEGGQDTAYTEFTGHHSTYRVPYWFLLVAAALLPLCLGRTLVKQRRAKRRLRLGLCAGCSYDLRAHKPGDRCPEYGAVISRSSKAGNDAVQSRLSHPMLRNILSPWKRPGKTASKAIRRSCAANPASRARAFPSP